MADLAAAYEFFAAYFHEDCLVDDPSWQAVVKRFVSSASPDDLAAVRRELGHLLALSDEAISRFMSIPCCYYDPNADGLSNRQWLEKLLGYCSVAG